MSIILNGTTGITTPDVTSDGLTVDSTTLVVDEANNRVGIGTSSPAHRVDAINTAGSASARFGSTLNTGANNGTVIITNGGTGDAMLRFDYEGTNTDRARIGVTASNQALQFFTAGNNERARIDSDGKFLVNTTTSLSASYAMSIVPAAGTGAIIYKNSAGSNTGYPYSFVNTANGVIGYIACSSTSTSYNTSSDYRLKEDWQPMTGATERVKALKPVNFAWKVDGSRVDGFLAHEAQAVVPEAVTGEKDAVDAEGNPEYQGIDQAKLVPLLTAALQEALAKIDDLTARVVALEGQP
jgi:hypothetical protein